MIRLAATLLAFALLSGCGIKGGLERPDPMWGHPPPAREEPDRASRRTSSDALLPPVSPATNAPAPAAEPAPTPN